MKAPKPTPRKTDRLALDLETFLIVPGLQAPPIASMGFKIASEKKRHVITASDPAFDRVVTWMLRDRNLLIHGHHFRFDVSCLLARNPEWAELIFQKFNDDGFTCTLIRDSLIRIARANPMHDHLKYDLATAYKLYVPRGNLQLDKEDENRMRWGLLAGMSVQEILAAGKKDAIDYLDMDVEAEDQLYLAQEEHGAWLLDEFNQMRASFVLYLMQCWGVRTDPQQVEALHAQTLAALEEAKAICEQHGLVIDGKRNIAAASAYQERAYAKLGLPAPRKEPTDNMREKVFKSAIEEGLAKGLTREAAQAIAVESSKNLLGNVILDEEACEESQDPVMLAYSKTSQAGLLLGKVRRLRRELIQASYNTLVNTGRTSCRQGKDPKKGVAPTAHGSQMQNPPRQEGIRECFVARPGFVIVSTDYDAFELRGWAQVCQWMIGYSKLGEILNDPKRDPHVEMGAMIHKLTPEEAYALKAIDKKRFKDLRQIAKAANFGLPGGMGAERFVASAWDSYQVSVTLDEAKEVIKAWKRVYPEAQPYLDLIGSMVGARGGRTRIIQHFSGRVRGGVGYCDAANSFFQGLCADAAKRALWLVATEMYAVKSSPLYGSRPLAFVHDELLCEIPIAMLQPASKRLQELWCGGAQEVIPDVLITAAPAASFRWSKAFGDPVYDAAGKLIPFEVQPGFSGMQPLPEHLEAWSKYATA